MFRRSSFASILMGAAFLAATPAQATIYGPCRFDSATLRFAGSVTDTAACLLRKVKTKGRGADPQPVPAWLSKRLLQPVPFTVAQVEAYLMREKIEPNLLSASLQLGNTPRVRYFVIHDTSFPEIEIQTPTGDFPSNINDASYSGNSLRGWTDTARRVNLITNRVGESRTMQPWGADRPGPATKIEEAGRVPDARQVFVHVENIQPRLDPPDSFAWIAPTPGLSPAQEKRLALAYIVASLHAGRWLIPAYHFNIDQGLPDVHDDPQNMDLQSWVSQLEALEAAILDGA